MQKPTTLRRIAYLALLPLLSGCGQSPVVARFNYFDYEGADDTYEWLPGGDTAYCNPVLAGFYPDPSVCRKGDTYYMVNSTFAYAPGIPVFRSRDLVHWTQLGNVIDRPGMLPLDSLGLSDGVYASTIRYNEALDMFYVISTCVRCGGNFVVKSADPGGPWSDPIWLPEVGGIDPSLFFDVDGRAWVVNNDAPPGAPRWNGHRAIWLHQYDTATDRIVGDARLLVDGGVDTTLHPVWIEGPHQYKLGSRYYLMCAEGGTGPEHSEVLFSSERVEGPYRPCPDMCHVYPMLTQRGLPWRRNPVTCAGHADLVDDPSGQLWAVFLACRPTAAGVTHTGRETFLLPVKQRPDSSYYILAEGLPVPLIAGKQGLDRDSCEQLGGNARWRTDFECDSLPPCLVALRGLPGEWMELRGGSLRLQLQPVDLTDRAQPSAIFHRQQNHTFRTETQLQFAPASERDRAGLCVFQNEANWAAIEETMTEGRLVCQVVTCHDGVLKQRGNAVPVVATSPLVLRLRADNSHFTFEMQQLDEVTVVGDCEGSFLSTEHAGGFVGNMLGLFATAASR